MDPSAQPRKNRRLSAPHIAKIYDLSVVRRKDAKEKFCVCTPPKGARELAATFLGLDYVNLSASMWVYDVSLRLGKLGLRGENCDVPALSARARKALHGHDPSRPKPRNAYDYRVPASQAPLGAVQPQKTC